MKVVQKEETVLKTVYVAFDGKEFAFPSDCRSYEENKCRIDANEACEKIPHEDIYMPGIDYAEEWTLFYVRTQEELDAVLLSRYCSDASARESTLDHFPELILSVTDEGYGWVETYDDFLKRVQKSLKDIVKKAKELRK